MQHKNVDINDIYEGDRKLYINPGVSLPGRDEPLGNAGGAAVTGPIGVDTELVADWDVA